MPTPLELLNKAKNNRVRVHTSDSMIYSGTLIDFDAYVNIDLKVDETCSRSNTSHLINGGFVTYIELPIVSNTEECS